MAHKAIYNRLRNKAMSLLWQFVHLLMQPCNYLLIKQYKKRYDRSMQPIFIIGSPRTGSTILYQLLTYRYQFSYIDNFIARWYRALLVGVWLDEKRFKSRPHSSFTSTHGKTDEHDPRAPHECGNFWYQWLPKKVHYQTKEALSDKQKQHIRDTFEAVMGLTGKPYLCKNLPTSQRIDLIHDIFPAAKFIWIQRDPRYTVQSILQVRNARNMKENEWWSVRPKNVLALQSLPEIEQVVSQVYYVESQIQQDLVRIPNDQHTCVRYTELVQTPVETIEAIGSWLHADKRDTTIDPASIQNDNTQHISDERFSAIERSLRDFSWPQYDK